MYLRAYALETAVTTLTHTLFHGLCTGRFDLYPVQGILIMVYVDLSSFPLVKT